MAEITEILVPGSEVDKDALSEYLENLEQKIATVTTPEAYGAAGDGSTDDAEDFQDALDAIKAAGGGELHLDATKAYLMDSAPSAQNGRACAVLIPSKVKIIGHGATVKLGANLPLGAMVFANESGDTGANVRADRDCAVTGVRFDCSLRVYPAWDLHSNPLTYGGNALTDVTGCVVRFMSAESPDCSDNLFIGCGGLAVVMAGNLNGKSNKNRFNGCGKEDQASYAIKISASAVNATVDIDGEACDNIALDHDYAVIFAGAGAKGTKIKRNYGDGCAEAFIHQAGAAEGFNISGNTGINVRMADVSAHGIEAHGLTHSQIFGNTFGLCERAGMFLDGVKNTAVFGNVLYNNGVNSLTYGDTPTAYVNGVVGNSIGTTMFAGIVIASTSVNGVPDGLIIGPNRITDSRSPKYQRHAYAFQEPGGVSAFGSISVQNDHISGGYATSPVSFSASAQTATGVSFDGIQDTDISSNANISYAQAVRNSRSMRAFSSGQFIAQDVKRAMNSSGMEAFFTDDRSVQFSTFGPDTGQREFYTRTGAATGTAQAGASGSITLAAGASSKDDVYRGLTIAITAGTGSGQSKTITSYNGSTKVAAVNTNWSVNPDNTSVYSITGNVIRRTYIGLGFVVGVGASDPAGGDMGPGTGNFLKSVAVNGIPWFSGAGTPEGVITAPVGSLYSRTDGGAGTSFYVKESGTGNTGWVAK